MTTEQKLITATDKDLPRLLGEVLLSEHDWLNTHCKHCGCNKYEAFEICNASIPITDWNEAMKWRDWAVGEVGRMAFVKALLRTMYIELELHEIDFTVVAAMFAIDLKPRNYLQAAAICKPNKLKGKL